MLSDYIIARFDRRGRTFSTLQFQHTHTQIVFAHTEFYCLLRGENTASRFVVFVSFLIQPIITYKAIFSHTISYSALLTMTYCNWLFLPEMENYTKLCSNIACVYCELFVWFSTTLAVTMAPFFPFSFNHESTAHWIFADGLEPFKEEEWKSLLLLLLWKSKVMICLLWCNDRNGHKGITTHKPRPTHTERVW